MNKRHCVLAGDQWATRKTILKLWTMPEILQSKKQTNCKYVLGQEILICPWTKVATDIFHFEGYSYLLIVNYTSRFPIVCKITSTTVQQVVSQMKLIFSEYGWPEAIVSTNDPATQLKHSSNW